MDEVNISMTVIFILGFALGCAAGGFIGFGMAFYYLYYEGELRFHEPVSFMKAITGRDAASRPLISEED